MQNVESVKEKIEIRIREHEEALEDLKRIRLLLAENPTLEELLDLMRKRGFNL